MAYEMLTGKLPFKADTAWEWATQHMTQNPIPIESLAEGMRAPEPMRAAIRKALAKSPDDRFQTVSEFEAAFAGGAIAAPIGTGTAAVPAVSSGGRQKTEMGAPIDAAAAFGAGGGSGGMMGMGPGPAAPAYTPAAGNMSMPTPAGIPQPPPRGGGGSDGGGKSNKGLILGIAGVIGVASVVAIVFAVKGGSSAPAAPFPSGTFTNSDPMTVLSGAAPTDTTPAPVTSGGEVPPLNGGGGGSGGHGGGGGGSGSGGHPPSSSGGSGSGSGGAKTEPPECAKARAEKAAGKPYQSDNLACISKGGHM